MLTSHPFRYTRVYTAALSCLVAFGFLVVQSRVLGENPPPETAAKKEMTGTLVTQDNRAILVNGQKAVSGLAVHSGDVLETSEDTAAVVQLMPVGRLEIMPATRLSLRFAETSAHTKVMSGCAALWLNKDFRGSLQTPQGKEMANRPEKMSVLRNCSKHLAPLLLLAAIIPGGSTTTGVLLADNNADAPVPGPPFSPIQP